MFIFQPGLFLLCALKFPELPGMELSGRRDALFGDFSKKPTSLTKTIRVTATRGELMPYARVLVLDTSNLTKPGIFDFGINLLWKVLRFILYFTNFVNQDMIYLHNF